MHIPSFLLITTGGTIDAVAYCDTPDNITPLGESLIPKALEAMGVSAAQFRMHAMPPADSKLFLTDDQHEAALRTHLLDYLPNFPQERVRVEDLVEFIMKQPEKHILITHGTDALARNAHVIWEGLKKAKSDKIVIFACAMIPLANTRDTKGKFDFVQSDGYANLKQAIQKFNDTSLTAGVYLSANKGEFFVGNQQLAQVIKEYNTPTPEERFFYLAT